MAVLSHVDVLADDRLDALRGQSLIVGGHTITLPNEPGPISVPVSVAEVLVAQAGWRYAPVVAVPRPSSSVPVEMATAPQARPIPAVAVSGPPKHKGTGYSKTKVDPPWRNKQG